MDQVLFTVGVLGFALVGYTLLAWLQRNEHAPHIEHPQTGRQIENHPTRRDRD